MAAQLEERLNANRFPTTIRFHDLENGEYPLLHIRAGMSSLNGKQWRNVRVFFKIDEEERVMFLPTWQVKNFTDECIQDLRGYRITMVKDEERISWKVEPMVME